MSKRIELLAMTARIAAGVARERRTRGTESRLGQTMRKNFPKWRKTRLRSPGGDRVYFWTLETAPPVPPAHTKISRTESHLAAWGLKP